MRQLVQLEKDRAMFMDKEAKIIALAVQDQSGAAQTVDATKAEFPILADADHHVADQYGVFDLLTDVSMRGKAAPAVFIIDQSNHIHWSHVAANINDRPSNQTILENLPK